MNYSRNLPTWAGFLIVLKYFRVSELLDYTADDLTGQSLYALCHGEDVHKMKKTHEDCKLNILQCFWTYDYYLRLVDFMNYNFSLTLQCSTRGKWWATTIASWTKTVDTHGCNLVQLWSATQKIRTNKASYVSIMFWGK